MSDFKEPISYTVSEAQLDRLGPDTASFKWQDPWSVNQEALELIVPRAMWESLERPGTIDIHFNARASDEHVYSYVGFRDSKLDRGSITE